MSTNGLQFIDFSFAPVTLQSGNDYQLDISFNGVANQRFYYNNNNNNVTFTTGNFTSLDGPNSYNTSNTVCIEELADCIFGSQVAAPPE